MRRSRSTGSVVATIAATLVACSGSPRSTEPPSQAPSPTGTPASVAAPSRIVALTEEGDIVLMARATAEETETIASFPPFEDLEVAAGSFAAVDVTALPDGRILVATCCEPAAGHIYVLDDGGGRIEEDDLFAIDAQPDPEGERLATGEIVGLVIRLLPAFADTVSTLNLAEDHSGFAPEDLSWSTNGSEILFTIGGELGLVDTAARSLAEATYVEAPPGTYWSGAALTVDGPVAVEQPGSLFAPSGPSRLVRVDLDTRDTTQIVPVDGEITDLTVDPSGRYLLWVDDGAVRWSIDGESFAVDGSFVAASWMPPEASR